MASKSFTPTSVYWVQARFRVREMRDWAARSAKATLVDTSKAYGFDTEGISFRWKRGEELTEVEIRADTPSLLQFNQTFTSVWDRFGAPGGKPTLACFLLPGKKFNNRPAWYAELRLLHTSRIRDDELKIARGSLFLYESRAKVWAEDRWRVEIEIQAERKVIDVRASTMSKRGVIPLLAVLYERFHGTDCPTVEVAANLEADAEG